MPIGRICWAARLRVAAPARNPWGSLCSRRYAASLSSQAAAEADLWRTRNIGIIAHIDAGKTTTTERMLYYSGHTRRIGDVDEGSTVTDFLPAERARGITIQSAAITFNWPPSQESAANSRSPSSPQGKDDLVPRSSISHNINLIDTPGHADFTFEVLRSLRILDGAVCILDGVAGVEAQTEKVWVQADHYKIPRIIYVNKLDRDGAAFAKTVKEIAVRLHSYPAVCQVPWWNDDGVGLKGVGDVVNMRGMLWERGSDGRAINAISWNDLQHVDSKLYEEMKKARIALVELLSNHDDEMVEKFLEHDEDHLAIPPKDIVESLRRCALQSPQMVVPVFGGASFKNIGVQPLLDAVVDLLPSPQERPDPEISIAGQTGALQDLLSGQLVINEPAPPTPAKGKKAVQQRTKTSIAAAVQNLRACALAFKVVNDARRGVLVYVRVYSGTLDRNSLLYNTNLNVTEKAPRLLKMYANDAVEVPSISAGQIGVIVGLKFARTGDTLISYPGGNFKSGPPAPINSLQLRPINVPPPVFFTSVEPNSLSEEKYLTETLAVLLREDPSLSVSVDPESGQTHLAGMGELHLEIARDRLLNDFKAKATTGKIEIGYREAIQTPSSPVTETIVREIAGKSAQAACTATVRPLELESTTGSEDNHLQTISEVDSNRLIIRHPDFTIAGESVSPESPALPPTMPFPSIISSIKAGVTAALSRGPNHGFPISAAEVIIDFDPSKHIFPDTTPAALSAAVRQAVRACIKQSSEAEGTAIMEPVMLATITVNESDLGSVMHDISSARGGQVVSLDGDSTESLTNPVSTTSLDDMPIIDPATVYTPPDPFAADGGGNFVSATDRQRHITARVPLKEMVGYLRHLRSLTGGRGTFLMQVDRFEKMSAQRQRALVNEMSGDYV